MDEQKPQQDNSVPTGNATDVQPPAAPAVAPAPPVEPGGTSVPDAPASPDAARQGLSPELLAQAQKETAKPDAKAQALMAAHGKAKKPKLPVIVAVVVALALSGAAVYAYMASQDDKKTPATSDTNHNNATDQTKQKEAAPATTNDVDDAAKSVDEAMNETDEASELPDGGLNEQSMGL